MSRKKNKKKSLIVREEEVKTGTRAKCWDSNLKISTDDKCPHISNRETPKIIMPYEIWHQIMALTKELDTEWLGYLGGSLLQNGDWKVTGMTIPKQEVTGSTVKPTDTIHAEGVVHSHVSMGCFFSGVDDDYLNENHGFSIVVNQRENNKAVVKIDLPCGSMSVIDADVVIEYPGCPDMSEFIEEAKKNIEEEKIVTHPTLRLRTWNQKTGGWDEAAPSKDDLGVPDYDPKHRKHKYKGWDYLDETNQCYC